MSWQQNALVPCLAHTSHSAGVTSTITWHWLCKNYRLFNKKISQEVKITEEGRKHILNKKMMRLIVFYLRKGSVQSTSQGLLSDISEEGRKPPLPCLPSYAHMEYLRTNYTAERNNKHNHIKSTLIISPYCNLEAIATWGKQQNLRRLFRSLGQKALGLEDSPRQLRSLPLPLCIAMRCAPLPRTFLRGQGGSNLVQRLQGQGEKGSG